MRASLSDTREHFFLICARYVHVLESKDLLTKGPAFSRVGKPWCCDEAGRGWAGPQLPLIGRRTTARPSRAGLWAGRLDIAQGYWARQGLSGEKLVEGAPWSSKSWRRVFGTRRSDLGWRGAGSLRLWAR